jgi:hypothetical protein
MHGTLGYVTPTDELAGVGARNLAERDHLLRETRESPAFDLSCGARGWVKGTTGLRLKKGLGGG